MIQGRPVTALADDRALLRDAQSYLIQLRFQDALPAPFLATSWELFHRVYDHLLHQFAAGFPIAPSEQDDVVQTVWARIVEGQADFRWDEQPGALRRYLYTMVRSRAIDLLRQRRQFIGSARNVLGLVADPKGDARAELERSFRQRLVMAALAELEQDAPKLSYQVFSLLEIDGFSVAEVVAQLGLPARSVYYRHYRMRATLREILAPYLRYLE